MTFAKPVFDAPPAKQPLGPNTTPPPAPYGQNGAQPKGAGLSGSQAFLTGIQAWLSAPQGDPMGADPLGIDVAPPAFPMPYPAGQPAVAPTAGAASAVVTGTGAATMKIEEANPRQELWDAWVSEKGRSNIPKEWKPGEIPAAIAERYDGNNASLLFDQYKNGSKSS